MTLDPTVVRSAPELAAIEILSDVLEVAIVALIASHPCLEHDRPCHCPLAPCSLADAIFNRIYELDNAIIHYRDVVERELYAEENFDPQF
jgi:hypothetical protein